MIYIPIAALCIVLVNMGSGRHFEYIQYVLPRDTVRRTEVLDFACHILYANSLLFARFSGLAFYHRVAVPSSKLYYAINGAFVFLVACYLPQLFLLIFHCIPVTGLWPYEWQDEHNAYRCLSWGLVYSVISALSLVCDFVMFTIPAIMIKGLRISVRKKLQLSCVLLPGILVVAISTTRLYLVIVGQWSDDGSWAYNAMLAVENAEIAGTLIALSVPALKPLFVNLFSRLAFLKSLTWNRLSHISPGAKSTPDGAAGYHKSTPNASRCLLDGGALV